jgi:hypothetical protein
VGPGVDTPICTDTSDFLKWIVGDDVANRNAEQPFITGASLTTLYFAINENANICRLNVQDVVCIYNIPLRFFLRHSVSGCTF